MSEREREREKMVMNLGFKGYYSNLDVLNKTFTLKKFTLICTYYCLLIQMHYMYFNKLYEFI
jgi:hypothetical protein